MNFSLQRFTGNTPYGVFGELTLPTGFKCFTVERPWKKNAPYISCIPSGDYKLVPTVYNRGRPEPYHTWEVKDVPGRTLIKIHRGNLARHVQGCIAVGTGLGCLDGIWAVRDSAKAFDDLVRSANAAESHDLAIYWRLG